MTPTATLDETLGFVHFLAHADAVGLGLFSVGAVIAVSRPLVDVLARAGVPQAASPGIATRPRTTTAGRPTLSGASTRPCRTGPTRTT